MVAEAGAKPDGMHLLETLDVTARAKRAGRIERTAPVIGRLRETGLHAADELVAQLLREVGE